MSIFRTAQPFARPAKNPPSGGTAASTTQTFFLTVIRDDMFFSWPFASDGALVMDKVVRIAKPNILRRATYDGKTINGIRYTHLTTTQRRAHRVGSSSVTDEIQVIVPDWEPGEIITANRVQFTDVFFTNTSGVQEQVLWQDVNDGARAFARRA